MNMNVTWNKKELMAMSRLLCLLFAILISYGVGYYNASKEKNSLIQRQYKLLNIYCDFEWRANTVIELSNVDSTDYNYKEYRFLCSEINSFYEEPINEDIAVSLNNLWVKGEYVRYLS